MPLFLNEQDVVDLLDPAAAVAAVEASFVRMAAGAVEIAPRRRLKLEEGRLADMAASDLELRYACVKAYAGFGDGAAFVVALFAVDRPDCGQERRAESQPSTSRATVQRRWA
jgi:ornithine cyclodeaminase/alanine dehydrogenase-like protein (mu-crystallin family)